MEIQAGRFKLPFGLEETGGSDDVAFIYRTTVSRRLAPGRDTGVLLRGRIAGKVIGYEAGLFAHDGGNARPNGGTRVFGGRTYAGRMTVKPFRRSASLVSDLQVGLAMTHSPLPEGYPAVRGRSLLGVSFFDADVWVHGIRRRVGLEARWRPGPVTILFEHIRLTDGRRAEATDNTDLPALVTRGTYVSGSWAFDVPNGGKLTPSARVERLAFGHMQTGTAWSTNPRATVVPGSRLTGATLGLAWRPTRWVAIEGNLVREQITGAWPASSPLQFISRLVRLQLSI